MATVSKQTSTSSEHVPATIEPSLAEAWSKFEAAFNRQDPREVASFWDEEGTLISPAGMLGAGRAEVEKVYAYDLGTFLKGTRSSFDVQRVRTLARDVVCMDCDHTLSGARMPDGSTGTMKLHLVCIARRHGDGWRWLDARPYAFVPAPRQPGMH